VKCEEIRLTQPAGIMAIRGIFREEGWAMPLLATAIAILCVLLIYTVTRFWFWMKPTTRLMNSFVQTNQCTLRGESSI